MISLRVNGVEYESLCALIELSNQTLEDYGYTQEKHLIEVYKDGKFYIAIEHNNYKIGDKVCEILEDLKSLRPEIDKTIVNNAYYLVLQGDLYVKYKGAYRYIDKSLYGKVIEGEPYKHGIAYIHTNNTVYKYKEDDNNYSIAIDYFIGTSSNLTVRTAIINNTNSKQYFINDTIDLNESNNKLMELILKENYIKICRKIIKQFIGK